MAAGRRNVVQANSEKGAISSAKQSAKYQFITSTPSHNAVQLAETKTLVRKHVMRDIGYARRRPHKRPNSNNEPPGDATTQNFSKELSPSHVDQAKDEASTSSDSRYQSPNPTTYLGAGRIDPFNAVPIPMDEEAYELIDHVWDDRNGNLQPFRDWWFSLGFHDPAAMHQILANSALHLSGLRGELGDDSRSIAHYTRGIKSVLTRLSDPSQNTSDGILGAILGLMCHDHIAFRVDRWRIHLAGFEKIVSLRGGTDTIENNKPLRLALFWIEHNACTEMDLVPHFPPPYQYLPSLLSVPGDHQMSAASAELAARNYGLPTTSVVTNLMNDLNALIALLKFELSRRNVWADANFVGLWFYPTLHKLLVLETSPDESVKDENPIDIFERENLEIFRLGAILFIAEIRRLCGVFPVITTHLETKLRGIFQDLIRGEYKLNALHTWTLIMAGIRSTSQEERSWIVDILDARYTDWDSIMTAASSLWWLDEVFLISCQALQEDYMALSSKTPIKQIDI